MNLAPIFGWSAFACGIICAIIIWYGVYAPRGGYANYGGLLVAAIVFIIMCCLSILAIMAKFFNWSV